MALFGKSAALEEIRHSLAHLLAAAVKNIYGDDAKLSLGPAIENGFYYDIQFPENKRPANEDLKRIEDKMREILATWDKFKGEEVSVKEAKSIFKGNPFKEELIDEIQKRGEKITLYKSGDFEDLCRGGHVKSAKDIDPESFKLDKVAGAYWRGDEKNPMLTRIYGLAFGSGKELQEYLKMREEAEKRDHKKLGKELSLFAFSPLVGSGLPLFLPKGEFIWHELEKFMREEKQKLGYKFVHIPHIAKAELYEKSGHLGKYDSMMPLMKDDEGTQFAMKAMNCPHHFEIYNAEQHSYKDLPFRIAETTTVYRNEKSGELSGLVRVKALTQDDTHHVIRHDQIESEISMILGLMDKVYKIFGFEEYKIQISIRDPKHPEKYFGDNALWEKSEKILIDAVKTWGRPYVIEEGEAAFYGPKIDIMLKDSIGRMWQLTTVQLDFVQPENFDMTYIGEDGERHRPAVLHVAILGSIERFMGILIEHFAGKFPVWLAPVQVKILPVGEKFAKYAQEIFEKLEKENVRVELSDINETLGKRIRQAEMEKVPYVLVVGEKEESNGSVNIRHHTRGQEGEMEIEKFLDQLKEEVREKKV